MVYAWLLRGNPVAEAVKLTFGAVVLVCFLPYVACQVVMCTAWEAIDKRTINMLGLCRKFSDWCGPKFHRMGVVAREADGFMVPVGFWLGVCLPAWFFYELHLAATEGFSVWRVLVYNICRIGPMYFNFMNTYVLSHKEGHAHNTSLYTWPRIGRTPLLRHWFNGWVGFFHGVLPACFPISHNYNHHKYDNNQYDVYCTAYRPRDSIKSWTTYLAEWFLYATNVSSIGAFIEEGAYGHAFWSVAWSAWYWFLVAMCWRTHALFTFCTIVYALVEGNIMLCAVNWVWHAFIEPDEPQNDYINSITIVEGLNFTMGEEFHAVHHQYAGMHWSKNEELYRKHHEGYERTVPSVFYKCNLFQVWLNIVLKRYDQLAQSFYKPLAQGKSEKELAAILKRRLQSHGPKLAEMQGKRGVEVVRDGKVVSGK